MSTQATSDRSRARVETPKLSLAGDLSDNFEMNLRKRPSPAPRLLDHSLDLGTCNSEFLSSLLADVAKAKEEIVSQKRAEGKNFELPSSDANKRRRLSLLNENRPKRSVKEASPVLDLLWEESWLPPPAWRHDRVHVVPPEESEPDLPTTVSASFEGLKSSEDESSEGSRKSSCSPDEHSFEAEDESGTFGWFVDMEEEATDDHDGTLTSRSVDPYKSSSSSSPELAFSAWTAPKATNYDAEVEWAKAADTVDDVLGDLF